MRRLCGAETSWGLELAKRFTMRQGMQIEMRKVTHKEMNTNSDDSREGLVLNDKGNTICKVARKVLLFGSAKFVPTAAFGEASTSLRVIYLRVCNITDS